MTFCGNDDEKYDDGDGGGGCGRGGVYNGDDDANIKLLSYTQEAGMIRVRDKSSDKELTD